LPGWKKNQIASRSGRYMGLASEFQLVDGQGKAFGIQIPRASAWGGRPLERSIVQDGTCKTWETIGTKAIILQLRMVLNYAELFSHKKKVDSDCQNVRSDVVWACRGPSR
jgi:hypothetical protein